MDLSFPIRYARTAVETCHAADIGAVADLTMSMITDVPEGFSLSRG